MKICDECRPAQRWYIGDTVDDARCAREANAPFIGIAAPSNPRYGELVDVLKAEKAVAILDDINQIARGDAMRSASIERHTKETQIRGRLVIEGRGR